jgi:hypothetical protein
MAAQESANPIFSAELAHLTQQSRKNLLFQRIVTLVFIASLLLTGCLYLISRSGSLSSVNLRQSYNFLSSAIETVNTGLMVLLFLYFLLLVSRTSLLATASVAREKRTGTWDLLVLTPQHAKRIVYGKWSAVNQAVLTVDQPGILLRVAAIFWIGLVGRESQILPTTPPIHIILIAPLLILLFTIANILVTSALGVLASFTGRSEITAYRMGMAFSLILLMLALMPMVAAFVLGIGARFNGSFTIAPLFIATTLLEGGQMLALMLLGDERQFGLIVGGSVIGLLIYGVVIWVALRLAMIAAARQGALPPLKKRGEPG